MSLKTDPLAAYRLDSEKKKEDKKEEPVKENTDPLAKYRTSSKEDKDIENDFLISQLKESGIEPTLEQKVAAHQRRNEGNFAKGVYSGATLGATRLVPGLKGEAEGFNTAGEVVGSLALPFNAAVKGGKAVLTPLMRLASNSPRVKKYIDTAGRLLGIGALGSTSGALHEATAKEEIEMPSVDKVLEHGAAWVGVDAALSSLGLVGRFAKALISKSKQTGLNRASLLTDTINQAQSLGGTEEKVAKTALDILEGKNVNSAFEASQQNANKEAKDLANNLKSKKIDIQDNKNLKQTPPMPYLPGEFQFEKIVDTSAQAELETAKNSVGERAKSEKQLGENIKNDIDQQADIRKQEISDLYKMAQEGDVFKNPNLQSTANAIVQEIQKLQKGNLKLTPQGYEKAQKQLFQFLEDIGYKPIFEQDSNILKEAVQLTDVNLPTSVEIKKRLNNIIDYELKETGAQDFLKNPTKMLREDIRNGYGNKESPQRVAFETAESKWGENASKLQKKAIINSRYTEKPESVAKIIKTPSGLHDVKQVVSEAQFKEIEREVVEHINSLPEEKARNYYREIKEDLSSNARQVAEEIIESKTPPSINKKAAQYKKIQDSVLEDISKASITGERPEKALNLWKTKKGQQIIKNSLEGNPNKKEIIDYLTDTSLKDFSDSVVHPNGEINFKKLNEFLKDPATVENIRLTGGEEAVQFFKQLETISSRLKKNTEMMDKVIESGSATSQKNLDKALNKALSPFEKHKQLIADKEISSNKLFEKTDKFYKSWGLKTKAILGALAAIKFGTVETIAVGTSYEIIKAISKSPRVRKAMKEAASSSTPEEFTKALILLDKAIYPSEDYQTK